MKNSKCSVSSSQRELVCRPCVKLKAWGANAARYKDHAAELLNLSKIKIKITQQLIIFVA